MNDNSRRKNEEESEIDLLELIRAILYRWWLVVITSAVGAVIGLAVTVFFITPKYSSQYMLYILSKSTSVTSLADIQIGSALTSDFAVIATSKPVLDTAIDNLKKNYGKEFTREQITSMLKVSNKDNTRILVIVATSANPEDASAVANAIGEATALQMADIMKTDPPTTVEKAEVSLNPISPNLRKNGILGFMAGFVLICMILTIQFLTNDTICNEADVERYLNAPVLVTIPIVKGKKSGK